MVIYTLYTQGPRFVESHICQNRADMGHPSFVTHPAEKFRLIENTSGLQAAGKLMFCIRARLLVGPLKTTVMRALAPEVLLSCPVADFPQPASGASSSWESTSAGSNQ
jgi:hypothetical protein